MNTLGKYRPSSWKQESRISLIFVNLNYITVTYVQKHGCISVTRCMLHRRTTFILSDDKHMYGDRLNNNQSTEVLTGDDFIDYY